MSESPDDHGSCFTVRIPLGKDHIPAAHIDSTPLDISQQKRPYGLGIVDEATHWMTKFPTEMETPSESSESGSSSEGSKLDSSTLFFSKNDVILLGLSSIFRSPNSG